jgi:multidrug efflux pump subunit AcrA (membrane-fusion protein)
MKRWIVIGTILILTKGSIVHEALAVGNIVPELETSVKSKIARPVHRFHVAVGDHVQAGDPLLDIRADTTPLERTEASASIAGRCPACYPPHR